MVDVLTEAGLWCSAYSYYKCQHYKARGHETIESITLKHHTMIKVFYHRLPTEEEIAHFSLQTLLVQ